MIQIKHRKYLLILTILSLALILFGVLFFQINKSFNVQSVCNQTTCVALVNSKIVERWDFEREVSFLKQFYLWSNQQLKDETTIRKDVLERIIEKEIAMQFAVNNNIVISDKEIEERYLASFNDSEIKYLVKIKEMYGMTKEDKLQTVKLDILKEKIEEQVKQPWADWITTQKRLVKIERFI